MKIDREKLIEELKEHEGYNWLAPKRDQIGKSKFGSYKDSLGYKTTGIGHLINDRDKVKYKDFNLDELTEKQAKIILLDDIDHHVDILRRFLKRNNLKEEQFNSNQLRGLVNMTFQLGDIERRGFKNATARLRELDIEGFLREMRDSSWYKVQTPKRARKVIEIFLEKEENHSVVTEKKEVITKINNESEGVWNDIIKMILSLFNRS